MSQLNLMDVGCFGLFLYNISELVIEFNIVYQQFRAVYDSFYNINERMTYI